MDDGEHDYFIPLQDQRVFGAGITRKGIAFVPAATAESAAPEKDVTKDLSMGDRYLSIVLPRSNTDTSPSGDINLSPPLENETVFCEVCNKSYPFSLEHSHPPSHIDRDNVGLKYLSRYGWNPDSRKGLGPKEEGIRAPIKAKQKNDTVGLRERIDPDNGKK